MTGENLSLFNLQKASLIFCGYFHEILNENLLTPRVEFKFNGFLNIKKKNINLKHVTLKIPSTFQNTLNSSQIHPQ